MVKVQMDHFPKYLLCAHTQSELEETPCSIRPGSPATLIWFLEVTAHKPLNYNSPPPPPISFHPELCRKRTEIYKNAPSPRPKPFFL
jgi:hypothetical protein